MAALPCRAEPACGARVRSPRAEPVCGARSRRARSRVRSPYVESPCAERVACAWLPPPTNARTELCHPTTKSSLSSPTRYVEGNVALELANEVFGFNGWSCSILSCSEEVAEQVCRSVSSVRIQTSRALLDVACRCVIIRAGWWDERARVSVRIGSSFDRLSVAVRCHLCAARLRLPPTPLLILCAVFPASLCLSASSASSASLGSVGGRVGRVGAGGGDRGWGWDAVVEWFGWWRGDRSVFRVAQSWTGGAP